MKDLCYSETTTLKIAVKAELSKERMYVPEIEYRLPACPHLKKYVGVSSHANYNTCDNLAGGGDELMIFMVLQ